MAFARAKSESPSREKAYELARKHKEDGFGPYRTEETTQARDSSMAVEDGRSRTSNARTSSGSSSSSGYRYVRRERVVQRGPR